ncbi:hypothetical protein [Celeribacter indicus]|uniref:Outer membrane autotransporter barrel n=1 Tax=Celeribacter indicus TaxID=1208324 RepID=A0A0B5E3I7_9RHOB|nr:hypothetical protein [Celeribacter indicus]AJE47945.1 Outer membrane autotransporter barrel [Celeribacter indicus]SDW27597.1 hypothetical protein SAMN05443573_102221 [Celeribacter indicus]
MRKRLDSLTGWAGAICLGLALPCAAEAQEDQPPQHLGAAQAKTTITDAFSFRAQRSAAYQPDLTAFFDTDSSGTLDAYVENDQGRLELTSRTRRPVWFRLRGQWSGGEVDERGYYLATLGAHRWISEDFLLGTMVEFDRTDRLDTRTEHHADGALAGPYFALRHADHPLYVEGRLLYGRTSNSVALREGSAEHFAADRLLAQLRMTGTIALKAFELEPFLGARYLAERQIGTTSARSAPLGYHNTKVEYGLDMLHSLSRRHGLLDLTGGLSGIWSETTTGTVAHSARIGFGARFTFDTGEQVSVTAEDADITDGLDAPSLGFGYKLSF